ncbi:MAG: small basic family protein [bacterium]|nr:small basic family protein [bacterium]
MLLPALGIALGIWLGFAVVPGQVPNADVKYLGVALLAAFDSALGGLRAGLEDAYDPLVFFSGFVTNTVLAALLTYIGDRLGVELYLAAVIAFGVRIFNNIAIMRRIIIGRMRQRHLAGSDGSGS